MAARLHAVLPACTRAVAGLPALRAIQVLTPQGEATPRALAVPGARVGAPASMVSVATAHGMRREAITGARR